MTQPEQSNSEPRCPRCNQLISFRKDHSTIYPHRDELVGAPCPMGGVDLDSARRQVREQRKLVKEMAR